MMINVLPDEQALAVAAADHIVQILGEALEHKRRASFVFTGGKTPEKTYRAIAARHGESIDWSRVDFFLGDERFVPLDHEESNFGMAREALLSKLPASDCETYPFPTTLDSQRDAAAAYEQTLRAYFGDNDVAFDLVLLGLGEDGHVASLFPGSTNLEERNRWVVPAEAPEGDPIRERLTMTFPLLNAGKHTMYLVAGAAKSDAVAWVRNGADVPGSRIQPKGELFWYLDREADSKMADS